VERIQGLGGNIATGPGPGTGFRQRDAGRRVLTNLGPPPNGTYSDAQSANTAGQVVGYATVSVGFGDDDHAFLWQDGIMTDLGTLGGDRSRAWAINGAGQVVGSAQDAGGGFHAFPLGSGSPCRDDAAGPGTARRRCCRARGRTPIATRPRASQAGEHTVSFGAVELPSCRVSNRTVRHIS